MAHEPELRHLAAGEGRKLLLLGDVRTIKASADETGGQLTIVEQVAAPGSVSALHRHPYQEVFYLLAGELEFSGQSDGGIATFRMAAGSTIHAAPGVAHGYRNAGTEPARFLAVMQPAGAEGFFAEVGVWLDEEGQLPLDAATPTPDEVRQAAARHGIEFLSAP